MSTITQVERGGLFEISEATLAELKSSKYYNDDLAPTSISERSWTTYSITMLWVGMAICIPSLSLASGLIGMGVSPWLSVLNVALGNIIILVPIQLNSQIGTKYGIPFPLFARLTFGTLGAQIPALLRAITACGWTSVQAWVGGGAVGAMIGAFVPKFADQGWTIGLPSWGGIQESGGGQFFGYVIFMLFIAWVAYNGIDQIKWVQNIGSPILIVVMIALLAWAYSITPDGTGFFEVMAQPNDDALIEASGGFVFVYLSGLMGNIAFWATMALNIPDFSRYAKTQKDQFRGQLYGMPLPMAACAFIGAYSVSYTHLCEIIAQLRAPGGCPWDIKQTHESLKKCLVEETGEVLEAIDHKDDANLCEELGDVLLQVVMHAQIAAEENRFTMDDVIQGVAEKMIRRHPHVFGDAKAETQEESLALWQEIKRKEKERK